MKYLANNFLSCPEIDQDIEDLAQNCIICVNSKNNPPKVDTHHSEWLRTPCQRIHIDYLDPVMGKMLIFVFDAHSKWSEVFIVLNTTTENKITCLSSLSARYGFSISLVSNNDKQLWTAEFEIYLKNHYVKHEFSGPYHPDTNGQIERYVQTLKRGIKALVLEFGTLQMKLNDFILRCRKIRRVTKWESPAFLFFKVR